MIFIHFLLIVIIAAGVKAAPQKMVYPYPEPTGKPNFTPDSHTEDEPHSKPDAVIPSAILFTPNEPTKDSSIGLILNGDINLHLSFLDGEEDAFTNTLEELVRKVLSVSVLNQREELKNINLLKLNRLHELSSQVVEKSLL